MSDFRQSCTKSSVHLSEEPCCSTDYVVTPERNSQLTTTKRSPIDIYISPVTHFLTSVMDASTQTDDEAYRRALLDHPFLCHHCQTRFQSKVDLSKHMTKHLPILCHLCPVTFKREYSFNRHMLYVHTDEKNFSCSKCPLAFKRDQTLQRHMREVHSMRNDEELFTPTFAVKSTQEHSSDEIIPELDERKDEAVFGGGSTIDSKKERNHLRKEILTRMKSSFMGEKQRQTKSREIYSCDQCSAKFKRIVDLSSHLSHAHLVNEIFSCDHCSKQFKYKHNLQRHIMSAHEIGKPYTSCQFTVEENEEGHGPLRAHTKLHPQGALPRSGPSPTKFKSKRLQQKFLKNMKNDHKPSQSWAVEDARSRKSIGEFCRDAGNVHACKLCSVSYRELKDLREHLAAAHSKY